MELNDDCLFLIFGPLTLKDQISVASVCSRFREIMTEIWQRKYIHFYDYYANDFKSLTCKDLSLVLSCICNTLQILKIHDMTFERFEILKLYTYPNLKKFTFHSFPSYLLKDADILVMTKLFPGLISLKLYGPFSGLHMQKWRDLRYLDLTGCIKKKFNCLQNIFERTQLKSIRLDVFIRFYEWTSQRAFKNFCSLESIVLNCYELKWLADISKFSNLKKLTVLYRDREEPLATLLKNLYKYKRNDIISIKTSVIYPRYKPLMEPFENLRKLSIYDQEVLDFQYIHTSAPNLREILFNRCEVYYTEELLPFIQNTRIEFISLQFCICGFQELEFNATAIMLQRTNELCINLYQNRCAEVYGRCLVPCRTYNNHVRFNIKESSPLFKIVSVGLDSVFPTISVRFQ